MANQESSPRAKKYNALDEAWNKYQRSGSTPSNLSPKTKELLATAIAIQEILSEVPPPDPSQKAAARERFLNAAEKLREQTAAVQEKK